MKTTRIVDHGDGHIDTEALFVGDGGEIWAVTDCNLIVEAPTTEEEDMYDGWTESPRATQARMERIKRIEQYHVEQMRQAAEIRTDSEWLDDAPVGEQVAIVHGQSELRPSELQMIADGVLTPNGGLISYASYKDNHRGKPLPAEDVDDDNDFFLDGFDDAIIGSLP